MKIHNFSAGPSILPQEVITKAAEAILNLNNSGLSLIEISHRSKDFIAIMEKAQNLVKELLNLPDGYSVLFLQGGASTQFLSVALNLLKVDGKAAYLDTGAWSAKALKEAKLFGEVEIIASSKDKNHNYIPKGYEVPADASYVHLTSNNTIFGTQFKEFPKTAIPVVCDMSSDIFSRELDFSQFDIVYAGAQKNMGPSGAVLVIVKDEVLG
jgi:phosphoserine aminotransferase